MFWSKVDPIIHRKQPQVFGQRRVTCIIFLCLLSCIPFLLHLYNIIINSSVFYELYIDLPYLRNPRVYKPVYPLPPSNLIPPNISIAILTAYTGKRAETIRPLAEPNKIAYAKYHGYSYINGFNEAPFLLNDWTFPGGRVYGGKQHFLKFVLLRHFLPLYDWIFWSDSDSIFLNFSRPLTDYIDARYDAIFAACPPGSPRWDGDGIINSGQMFFRNSPWTMKFLEEVMPFSNTDCTKTKLLRQFRDSNGDWNLPYVNGDFQICRSDGKLWQLDQGEDENNHDQNKFYLLGALQLFINYGDEETTCHLKRVGMREFNSLFPYFEDGDFVVHFPGWRNRERYEWLRLLMERTNFTNGTVNRENAERLTKKHDPSYGVNQDDEFPNNPCRDK